jgi:hypothetical protein
LTPERLKDQEPPSRQITVPAAAPEMALERLAPGERVWLQLPPATVQVRLAAEASAFPAASVAFTAKV